MAPHLKCDCFACVHNLKAKDFVGTELRVIYEAEENAEIAFRNVKKMKVALKNNWNFITAHCDDPKSADLASMINTNDKILVNMAYKASFPC